VDGVSPYPRWELKGVFAMTARCPRRDLPADVGRWLDLYSHYRAGHLYSPGGVENQPAKYLVVMRLIAATVGEIHG
jgi:hypothetical protein